MTGQVVIGIPSEYNTCSSELVSSLREELKNLPPLSSDCCIYRTPETLRKQNVQVYTPHLVSIGPYHYKKKEDYENMEVDKRRYLQKFLEKTGMNLEIVVKFIKERETRIRNSYDQYIDLSSDELVRMVLLDTIFAFIFICDGTEELRVKNDRVFGGSTSMEETAMDMLMLENQLPFFIFVDLAKLVLKEGILTEIAKQSTCIYEHCYQTFKVCISNNIYATMDTERSDIKHIVDLLRRCLLPSVLLPATNKYDYEQQLVPNATELHEAGVKFKVALSKNNSLDSPKLLDVQFANKVLKIPRIYVNFRTETLFRNIVAFEQCHCEDRYVSEYIYLMSCLIKTPMDVELLVRYKIMVNDLGNNQAASTLFSNMGKGIISKLDNDYFGTLKKDLIKHYNFPHHKWMATLKHDYFNTPWKILSVITAISLIVLTLIQAIFAILSYK